MDFEIVDSHHALTREEISRVEQKAGVSFPDDYVRFLLRNNGGWFRWPVAFKLLWTPPPPEDQTGNIEIFSFIGDPDDPGDLDEDLLTYDPWITRTLETIRGENIAGMLRVGCADFGWVYLCCIGEHRGEVYLQRNAISTDGDLVRLVSRSFEDFLGDLYLKDFRLHCADPIFRVIEKGDVGALALMLDGGLPVDTRNDVGETLLMFAAKTDTARCMQLLLDRGADIGATDTLGETPLHISARHGNLDATRLLLNAGADINARSSTGETPLLTAMKRSRRGRPKLLLVESGADLTVPDHEGTTAFLDACLAGVMGTYPSSRLANEVVMQRDPNPRAAIPWIVKKIREGHSNGCVRLAELGATDELLQLLREGNYWAGSELVHIVPDRPDFHATLRALLTQHSNVEIRRAAASLLGFTHFPSAENLAALEAASLDSDPKVVEQAKWALEWIRKPKE